MLKHKLTRGQLLWRLYRGYGRFDCPEDRQVAISYVKSLPKVET